MQLGPGGSTAVTAIVIDGKDLWVANIGDSRAVVCERGCANQITVDHEPHTERRRIEEQGGFVTLLPGKTVILRTFYYANAFLVTHESWQVNLWNAVWWFSYLEQVFSSNFRRCAQG